VTGPASGKEDANYFLFRGQRQRITGAFPNGSSGTGPRISSAIVYNCRPCHSLAHLVLLVVFLFYNTFGAVPRQAIGCVSLATFSESGTLICHSFLWRGTPPSNWLRLSRHIFRVRHTELPQLPLARYPAKQLAASRSPHIPSPAH